MRVLASRYALTPVASGVRLDYAGQIVPGFELVGRIEQMVVRRPRQTGHVAGSDRDKSRVTGRYSQ